MIQIFKFLFAFLFAIGCSSKSSSPNVIFILVDDLGWNDLGYSGSKFYETPNIDALSRESFQFTNAYAASPVCSPTRASIMTGKHPARVGITDWIPGVDPKNRPLIGPKDLHQLPLEEITIAEKLKESGYKTFYAGKWHLGSKGFYPEQSGFDVNIGGFEKGSPMGGYYSPYKNPKLSDGPEGEYLTDRLTDESIRLIKNHDKDHPFALFLSFYNVHTPIQANLKHLDYFKKKLLKMDDNSVRTKREGEAISRLNQTNAKYASMVYAVDENVGKLIKNLKDNNLYENSLIIFTSDNGGLSTLKRVAPTSVYPLRAGKGWLYEGGIRIPQLIKTPGNKKNVKIDDLTASYDLFPTILDFAGIKNNKDIDGVSLMPRLKGQSKIDREDIFWHFPHYHGSLWKPGSAIRSGDWKLVLHYESNNAELFNLMEDPKESNDLSLLFDERKQILLKKLNKLKNQTNAKEVSINPNFKN
ncbi:MAG: sulfatase [Flavobacteriaceae bacterium]|jgi:arylsulfatase A-like enzyme|nr:sulfatase [Flavobacteriaceae bacterium]